MKKWNHSRTLTLLLAVACLIGTSACSSEQTNASSAASSEQAEERTSTVSSGDQNTIYGKVTAVDGEKITLALGTLNERGGPRAGTDSGQGPDGKGNGNAGGSASGDSGKGRQPDGSQPAGKDGARPEGTASRAEDTSRPSQGGGSGADSQLTLTGETKTITVSDESILSRQQMGFGRGFQETSSGESSAASQQTGETAASLSDIQEGTILKIVYQQDGQTLSSVVILGGSAKN